MKPNDWAGSVTELAGGQDGRMRKIVEEVDRFFKNFHADIEDWKFSMEDFGDGTRIFVRFQIHINSSGASHKPSKTLGHEAVQRGVTGHRDGVSVRSDRPPPAERMPGEDPPESDTVDAAKRADLDLASFVEVWRGKRDSDLGGEYHKEGAPDLDSGSEWNGHTRSGGDGSLDGRGKRTDEEPKVPELTA
jgi:hypothetical protein